MSEKVLASIAEQLNQEKWTRAALGNFTTQAFKDLDVVLNEVVEAHVHDEVLEMCEEHLRSNKNSIIALYVTGILNLTKQTINDSNLLILINMFTEANRWKIAEWLAERILDFGDNKHAYRTLASCYENEGNQEKKFEVWEKLVRVDYEEADIVRQLAERAENQGNTDSAVSYYKKALHRYINRRMFNNVRETWKKLIELCPEETEFFWHAEGKVAKILSEDRSVMLLEDLYPWYKQQGKWDIAIELLKRIVHYDPKSPTARNEIVLCYKNKYKDHSQLEEYIRLSNLSATWRSIHDAIADFEKHIAFDAGNYVFHRTWGVGLIGSIKDDTISIDFPKNRGHKMSLKLAVNALTILGRDHFWVTRMTMKPEKLKEKVLKDPVWALKTIIKSFDNRADMKRIKAELADSRILEASEWSNWSTKARNILKTDELFGNVPDKPDVFVVRDQPISLEEKTFNRFKAEKDFFNRIKILQEFLTYVDAQDMHASVESDLFREMFEYFVAYVRNMSQVNEFTLGSMLVVNRVIKRFNFLNPGVSLNFREAIEALGDTAEDVFIKLNNSDLRRDLLTQIRLYSKTWERFYLRFIPLQPHKESITELVSHGHAAEVQALFSNAFGAYRDNRELVAWFIRNCHEDAWFKELKIPEEKLLIALIHLYDISARDVDNKKDISENRRINKQVGTIIFKEGLLQKFIATAEPESISRVYSLISDAKSIEPEVNKQLRASVKERYPDFKFPGETEKEREIETVSRSGFYTIYKSYEEKQKALQALQEIEVPKNSREIAAAREYGDLRENAEYKAAKERQEILNSTAARWKAELEQAKAMKQEEIDETRVGFGTSVVLQNVSSNTQENYTIMGPWESNPDEGIISYLSPFGAEIFRHGVGDELKFVINERPYHYKIKKITKVDLKTIKTTTQVSV